MGVLRLTRPLAPVRASAAPERSANASPLSGRFLIVARVVWIIIALAAVSLFIAAVPAEFAQLRVPCPTAACPTGQLSPAGLRAGRPRPLARLVRGLLRRNGCRLRIGIWGGRGAHLLAQVRGAHGAVRFSRVAHLRDVDPPGNHGDPSGTAPCLGGAGRIFPISRLGLVWPLLVSVSGLAVRAPLDALGGAGLDCLAGAKVLLSQLVPRSQRLARPGHHGGVVGCSKHRGLLAGPPLPACVEPGAEAADQVGSLRYLGGARGIPRDSPGALRLGPDAHITGRATRTPNRVHVRRLPHPAPHSGVDRYRRAAPP